MKRTLSFLSAITLVLLIAGCGDDPASSDTGNGSVSAKVAGGAWAATTVQSSWTSNVLGIGGTEISGGTNRQINITAMITGPGTYQINPFAGINASYTEGSGSGSNVRIFTSTSGELVVTTVTSSGASGTFSFSARESQGTGETRAITEGTFNVKY